MKSVVNFNKIVMKQENGNNEGVSTDLEWGDHVKTEHSYKA
jgi:hypothetical protein